MAVVSCHELPRERSQSGKFNETYRHTRGFMVRVDDPATPLPDVTNSCGINFLDPHPDDLSCVAQEFNTKPESNSLLHYTVSITYYARPKSTDSEDGTPPEFLPGLPTVWTATSSIGTAPLLVDIHGNAIKNSADTPIPNLSYERAMFKLSLKRPWPDMSWAPIAKQYTNAVNSDTWMGSPPLAWKCQGMSAAPQTQNEAGVTRFYWETSWEFEYRAPWRGYTDGKATTHPGWSLGVIDKGFQARVDEDGNPDPSPLFKIGTVRDKKGQPIKEPVGLRGGNAIDFGQEPDTLEFRVYPELPFSSVFGV